jgi:hypothetical protein
MSANTGQKNNRAKTLSIVTALRVFTTAHRLALVHQSGIPNALALVAKAGCTLGQTIKAVECKN